MPVVDILAGAVMGIMQSTIRSREHPLDFITLSAASQSATSITPSNAIATLQFFLDILRGHNGSSYNTKYTWVAAPAVSTDYEIKFTHVSGTVASGVDNTWGSPSSKTASLTQSVVGSATSTFAVRIRAVADPSVELGPVNFTLNAEEM